MAQAPGPSMAQAPRGAKRSAGAMLFVSRLPVGAAGNCGVRRALKHAFAPFGGSRLKLGMTDQRRLVGYAWVDVRDAEAAQEAINALDGRLRLLCDALTVRPPDGAQLFDVAPAGAELAARDAAHDSEAYDSSGTVGVNFVTDKRDLFFPSLSYNLKRRLRFDDVAWYSVMDELHAGRLGNVLAAVAATGAREGLSKECAVLDVFGCVGGTAIALARGDFASVEACELDAGRADMLRHNADVVLGAEGSLRAKLSVFHGDGIARARGTNAPIVFLDPPWATSIGLESTIPTFDGLRFEDFIFELCAVRGTAIVAARLPKKYDVEALARLLVSAPDSEARERPLPFKLDFGAKATVLLVCRADRSDLPPSQLQFGLDRLDAVILALRAADSKAMSAHNVKFWDFDAQRWIHLKHWKGCRDSDEPADADMDAAADAEMDDS